MKRIGRYIFTVVLAAVLLFTMPGMASCAETASYTEAKGVQTKEISGDTAGQAEADRTEEPKAEESKDEEPKTEDSDTEKGEEAEAPEETPKEDEEGEALMESSDRKKTAARSGAQSERTENSIACVTIDGVTKYYERSDYFRLAWKEAQGKTALIRILQDIDLGRFELTIDNADSNFTLEMEEGVTLSGEGGSSGKRGFMLVYAGNLTMKSGTLHNTMSLQGWGIDIRGASFTLEGGTVKTDGSDGWNTAVHAQEGSTVVVKGGEIIADKYGLYAGNSSLSIEGGTVTAGEKGSALFVSNCDPAKITGGEFTGGVRGIYLEAGVAEVSGGTFTGNSDSGAGSGDKTARFKLTGGTFVSTNRPLSGGNGKPVGWLEEGCCYYDLESGNIIPSAQLTDYYIKGYPAVRVGECNHSSWEDWTIDEEDNHSHICEGCRKTDAAPHQWDADKRCTVCGWQAAACVTTAGETAYYALLENAWKAAQGKKATVALLRNVDLGENTLEMKDAASDIRLEMAEGVILERPKNTGCLIHVTEGSFTFAGGTARVNFQGYADQKETSVILMDGGNVRLEGGLVTNVSRAMSYYGSGIKVNGGSLVVSGGEIVYPNAWNVGIQVTGGEVLVQGGSIICDYRGIEITGGTLTVEGEATFQGTSGYGLYDAGGISTLCGGTFSGRNGGIYGANVNNLNKMLGPGCVYYKVDEGGNRTVVKPAGGTLGSVAVDLCDHEFGKWTADGAGAHSRICKGCGFEEKKDCDLEYSDISDAGASGGEGAHVGVCKICGHRTAQQPHDFASWGPSGMENGYVRACKACGRKHEATIARSAEEVRTAYGTTGEQKLSCEVTGAAASYVWKLQGAEEVLGTEKGYTLPDNLPVGDYTYQCAVTLEGGSEPVAIFSYSLHVTPAELAEATVTVAEGESIFYDGKEKEPDVTVKLRGKTLTRDVDYIVSYADHVKVGTGTLTVIGIGNYAGTLTDTFMIRYYETEKTAEGPKDWCNRAKISAPEGFTVSPALNGGYGDAFFYGTETGAEGVEVAYYLKQDGTGYITDAKTVKVKVDTTGPSLDSAENGIKITDRDAWWQKLLTKITFGRYKTQEVRIQAADSLSGIDRVCYHIDRSQRDTPFTAEELEAVSADQWECSDSVAFTLDGEGNYVIYAYAVDKAGNQSAYICSDGIVIDNTPPVVTLTAPSEEQGLKDTGAVVRFRMEETGNVTYILRQEAEADITVEDIFAAADKGTGSVTAEQVGKDMELYFDGLKANTAYYFYAVGTDAAGNDSEEVASLTFTTLKSAIAGRVSLTGREAYGETLRVTVTVGTADSGEVFYRWYRIDGNGNEAEIAGATSGSYMLTAADIGYRIRAKVTAQNCSGSLTAETGGPIQKADPPVENMPVNGRVNDGPEEDTFTFTGKSGVAYEYSVDGGSTWKTMGDDAFSPDVSDGTKVTGTVKIGNYAYGAGQIQVRSKETETAKAGGVLKNTAAFTATLEGSVVLTGEEKYGETLMAEVNGAQSGIPLLYSFYRDGMTAALQTGESNAYTLTAADIGKHIFVRVTAAGYTGTLEAQTAGIVGKAEGGRFPGAVSGSYTTDGRTYTYTVNGVVGAEYRMDGGTWQKSNVFEAIRPGTSHSFEARMAETDCYEAGAPKGTGQVAFPKITPPVPPLQYQVDKSEGGEMTVTVVRVDGAEYSFDGGSTWGSENSQSGLSTSQTVKVAIRLKATDTHNQSAIQTAVLDLAKENREAPPAFALTYEPNGETDYTVTIPFTEGCEYSFDGENWSDDNVKAGVGVGEIVTGYKRYKENEEYNVGSAVSASKILPKFTVKTPVIAPAGGSFSGGISVSITCGSADAEIYYTTDGTAPDRSSARYTGAFTVTAPVTVKAIAVKAGMTDSAVATAIYTKQNSGGSGSPGGGNNGSGSGNGGSGGENEDGKGIAVGPGGDSGQGNRTDTTGGTGGNAPGREKISGSKNVLAPGAKQPFIKGKDGKIGWDVIRAEEEKAEEGSVIHIDMNGSTVVPGDIFDSIRDRDIVITFDMGDGILWSVDGKSILIEKAGDIDLSVKKGTDVIPVDIINNVSGESYSIQISLAYEGEFGFTAVLSIDLGSANAGYIASLYYYRENTAELEFICADKVAQDGRASLAFTHASDYVIVIEEEESGTGETAQPKIPAETEDKEGEVSEGPEPGQSGRLWWIFVIILAAAVGTGTIWALKKRERERN